MFERFTEQSRRAVVLAQEEARLLRHSWIGPEHLFLALVRLTGSEAARALTTTGVTLEQAHSAVLDVVGLDPTRSAVGHMPFTEGAKTCLALALRAALDAGSDEVRSGHLLHGVIEQPGPVLERVLDDLGVDRPVLDATVTRIGREDPEHGSPDAPVRLGTAIGTWGTPPPGSALGLVACGFCGRVAPASGPLVSGRSDAAICAACATAAVELFDAPRTVDEGAEQPRLWMLDPTAARAVPGMSAAEAALASASIREVFADLQRRSDDGDDAVLVEDGEGLGICIGQAAERFPHVGPASFAVSEVEFLMPERARVVFTVSLASGPVVHRQGGAVLIGGAWKATRETLTELLAMAGVQCPPPRPPRSP